MAGVDPFPSFTVAEDRVVPGALLALSTDKKGKKLE